jgi:hypothetical protein
MVSASVTYPEPDGSVDLYFGPKKPKAADAKSWIQTLKEKAFIVAIRLYGSGTEFYDESEFFRNICCS